MNRYDLHVAAELQNLESSVRVANPRSLPSYIAVVHCQVHKRVCRACPITPTAPMQLPTSSTPIPCFATGRSLQLQTAAALQGVSKLSTMATPLDVLSLLSSSGSPALHDCTCAGVTDDVIFVGTQQGQVAVITLPLPGEHSVNTALRAPDPALLQLLQVHGASVTAIAVVAMPSPALRPGRDCSDGPPVCVAIAGRTGAICLAVFSRDTGSGRVPLTILRTMNDTHKSITDLVFVCGPTSGCASTEEATHCGVADACCHDEDCEVALSGKGPLVQPPRVAPAAAGVQTVLLFACAHADKVHRWRIDLEQMGAAGLRDADATELGSSTDSVTYCGAMRGASGSAFPVRLCALPGSKQGPCPDDGSASTTESGGLPPAWVLAGCTDRSVRGWAVTPTVAELPVAEAADLRTMKSSMQATTATTARPLRPTEYDGAMGAEPEAVQPPGLLSDRVANDDGGGQAPATGRGDAPTPQPAKLAPQSEALAMEEGLPGGDRAEPSSGSDAAFQLSATMPSAPHSCKTVTGSRAQAADTPLEYAGAAAGARISHALSGSSPVPAQRQETPQAPAQIGGVGPSGGTVKNGAADRSATSNHGCGHAAAAGVAAQSVGNMTSRYAPALASDTSRHRPRATSLGTASLMSRYVDARLQALTDAPGNHYTGLPGASCSSMRAEETLKAAADHGTRAGGSDSGKGASSARLTVISAAHRAALCMLLQGDVTAALDAVVAADALNADFVAMSAAAGPQVWRAVVALHAARLEASGDIHLATAYLCSAQDFEGATHAYQRAGLLLEAVTMAERHLPPRSALLRSLRQQLVALLLRAGGGAVVAQWRGEVMAAAGGLGDAIREVIASGAADERLMHASSLAEAAGETELTAELAARAALQARTAAAQAAGMRQALRCDIGMAAVAAAVGTVAVLLEGWLLTMLRLCGEGSDATLEHAVRAAAVVAKRHVEVLGIAANSRASLHAVQVGGDIMLSAQDVVALATDLAQRVAHAGAPRAAALMHAAELKGQEFPCGLHVAPALYALGEEEATAGSVSLADMESVVKAFSQAVGHSVRACLRVSHHVVGAPLQPAAVDVLRERLQQLLWPPEGAETPKHAAADSGAAPPSGAIYSVSGALVDATLARMSGNTAASDEHSLQTAWRGWLATQLGCLVHLPATLAADGEAPGDVPAADRIPWVAVIDEFVEAGVNVAAEVVPEPQGLSDRPSGFVELRTGPPTVSVSSHALLQLGDSAGASSMTGICEQDRDGPAEARQGKDMHAEKVCVEHRSNRAARGKKGKAQKRSGGGGGVNAREGLSHEEVVSFQQALQAFGPRDWARFRREAMRQGFSSDVNLHEASVEDEEQIVQQVDAAVVGGDREKDTCTSSDDPGLLVATACGRGSGARDRDDVVLTAWRHALSSYPGM